MSLGFSHTLKTNHKNERPSYIMVFDVESNLIQKENKQYFEPFLWSAVYLRRKGTKWLTQKFWGTDFNEFYELVEKHTYPKSKLILASHHLEPDLLPSGLLQYLLKSGWILRSYIFNNKTLVLTFNKEKKTLTIMNSGNIFQGSVESLGNFLGIPKLSMPKSSFNSCPNEWINYCMRDSEIIAEMFKKYIEFLDIHNLGSFQHTAASQAMTAFRHRFMSHSIAIHKHPEVLLLERDSYHGGRFEAFVLGKCPEQIYYQLDINSMYGYIMLTKYLPYELKGYITNCSLEKLQWLLRKYAVVASVTVSINEPVFPTKTEGKIKYLSGTHRLTLTSPELKYVLQHGQILQVHHVAFYYKAKILSEYMRYFLSLRRKYKAEGNKPFEQITKLFINSLYGKFGQYGYKDKIIGDCDPSLIKYEESYDLVTHRTIGYFFFGGKIRTKETTETSHNTLVALASHITAYGRLYLWQLVKRAGIDNTFHVATDSLIVNQAGYDNLQNLIDPNKTGYLKVEKIFTSLEIRAPNDMRIDNTEKIKGISRKAEKVDDDTFIITYWHTFNSLLKKGHLENYYTSSIRKTLRRETLNKIKAMGLDVARVIDGKITPLHN